MKPYIIPFALVSVVLGVMMSFGIQILVLEFSKPAEAGTAPFSATVDTPPLPEPPFVQPPTEERYQTSDEQIDIPEGFSFCSKNDYLTLTSPDYKTAESGEVTTGHRLALTFTDVPEDWTWLQWAGRGRGAIGSEFTERMTSINGTRTHVLSVTGYGVDNGFKEKQSVIEWTLPNEDGTRVLSAILATRSDLVDEDLLNKTEDFLATVEWE